MTQIKICGITTRDALETAVEAGVQYVGFVFAQSPRQIAPEQARPLIDLLPATVRAVGLFINPTDDEIRQAIEKARISVIQLHGDESPERVRNIKNTFGKTIIKAIRVNQRADILTLGQYALGTDWLLLDAKVSGSYGGTGHRFDWNILKGVRLPVPWVLAGGLTPETVGEAITSFRPDMVDVSSGVESARGQKDACKIRAFVDSVRHADQLIQKSA